MIQSVNITRRAFLARLVYFGAFGVAALNCSAKPRTSDDVAALSSKLSEFHHDTPSAKVVGLEYLHFRPSEANADVLVDLIASVDGERRAEFTLADKKKLRDILRAQQCHDFEHERVVNVRGWILSETECRLCALAALL
jgi:hypothetical protein